MVGRGGSGTGKPARNAGVAVWWCGVLGVLLVLGGCDVLISGTVPAYLPYVTAELDLTGTLPAAVREVNLEVVPAGPDNEAIFVLVVRRDTAGEDTIVMVDSRITVPRVVQESTSITRFDTRAFRRTDGAVQVGNLVYDPVARVLTNGPRLEDSASPVLLKDVDGEYLVAERTAGGDLLFRPYDASFIPTGGADLLPVSAVGMPAPAERFSARMFSRREMDLVLVDSEERHWFATVVPGEGIETPAFLLMASGTLETATVQRTAAGILGRTSSGELVRFHGETGEVLDRFRPAGNRGGTGEFDVIFDPAGEFYVLLDRRQRVLYRVAPWW